MTGDAWIVLAVLAVAVLVLVRELVPPAAAMLGGTIALLLLGVLSPEQAFAGFANSATITIAALFIVARAVRQSGGLTSMVSTVLGDPVGDRRALARLTAPVALLSGVMNNTPIVATLAPIIRNWSLGHKRSPSRYLMPLSFAAILGGLLTTIGTSTTLVVSGVVQQYGGEAFSMFEVTPVGLPIAAAGVLVLVFTAPRLLVDREGPAEALETHERDYTFRLVVEPGGPLDGATVASAGLRNLAGVYLARIDRAERVVAPISPEEVLAGHDVMTFVGRVDQVVDLAAKAGLVSLEEQHVASLEDTAHQFYEVVVGSSSSLTGRSLKQIGFRERYDAAVVGLHRSGERVDRKLGQESLRVGDVLLVLSGRGFAARWRDSRDFLLVTALGPTPPGGKRQRDARVATAVLVIMVVLSGAGVLPILEASLLAVIAIIATRTLTIVQARNAVDLDVIMIIAGALGLGAAVEISGLAGVIASRVAAAAGTEGPFLALATVMFATLVLTELISNTAAAALMVPIGLDVATALESNPRGFAIAIAMMASASFLTPVGYQTNTMVYALGGYRYADYWRLGLPLTVTVYALTLLLVNVLYLS